MDSAGFDEFVAARQPSLLRYATALTGDPHAAADLLQHALTGTWRHWRRIRDGSPEAYVRRAMLHAAASRWRRQVSRESVVAEPPDGPVGPDHAVATVERDALWRALRGLPPRQRAVLVLRFLDDLSEAETAALLGISTGTVKSSTSRALASLRLSSVGPHHHHHHPEDSRA